MLTILRKSYHLLVIALLMQSCAPVFSDVQSARTAGDDCWEITPVFTNVNYTERGTVTGLQNHIGIHAAYGITPRIDVRIRYEYIWLKHENADLHIIGMGPKFSLLENKIAFHLPFGFAVGKHLGNTLQVHPTLLFTFPLVEENIEVTLAPKYLITACDDCEDVFAVNLSAALSTHLSRWAIRPEYGILFNPGYRGFVGQFSIGLSFSFGTAASKPLSLRS